MSIYYMKQIISKGIFLICISLQVNCTNNRVLPESWIKEWDNPGVEYRPLQIVHGEDMRDKAAYYKDSCGLGGVICNVPVGENYLKSDKDWKIFVEGVKAMRNYNLRVWIYDEDGYPSLGAGGRVLEKYPELEALEIVYEANNKDPFTIRPSYEYTHACNNYHTARRYPNPLDPKATEKFIEFTHQAYRAHLGPELYSEIEAFFTDEPSMIAVNTGELGDSVRKSIPVTDPIDPLKKNLPMASWTEELPQLYKEKYGEDLIQLSLFKGNQEKDKIIRQKFWSLLGEMNRNYFYKAIQQWCDKNRIENKGIGPVSSGHGLREESPSSHIPLDGNKLFALMGLDIPGLDQLSSDPAIWTGSAWMSTAFPSSASILNSQRRVMCEMSDFEQRLHGKGPVPVEIMQAAAAWQMLFGVTDFALYYTINYGSEYPYRNEESHRKYCNFIGRVNSILMDAEPERNALLYYPVYDLQREYIPTAKEINITTQSPQMQLVENSFMQLGSNLLQAQIQFVLVDYLMLENTQITENGTLKLGNKEYSSVFIPKDVVLPASVSDILKKAKENGVKVMMAERESETPTPGLLQKFLDVDEQLQPGCTEIAYGKFIRDGREIFALVNTGENTYSGILSQKTDGSWVELDPHTGQIIELSSLSDHSIPVELYSNQTKIFVKQ